MRAWAGNMMGTVVWRKVFTDHPALLEVFAPGNEQMLATARQSHEKLEQAIQRFGMPPVALMQELLHGGSGSNGAAAAASSETAPTSVIRGFFGGGGGFANSHLTTGRMSYVENYALKPEDFQHFFAQGYIKVENAVCSHTLNTIILVGSVITRSLSLSFLILNHPQNPDRYL
jgi:hypothetical protein